jgi:hypothetical protein
VVSHELPLFLSGGQAGWLAVPHRQLVGVHHHARREDQLHVAAAHPRKPAAINEEYADASARRAQTRADRDT